LVKKLAGLIFLIMTLLMLLSMVVALIYREHDILVVFGIIAVVLLILGVLCYLPERKSSHQIKIREGFFTVSFCWILVSLIGALPYFFGGILPNFIDSFFESVSDITTTGANLFANPEALPHTILFWRSLINWIGGLGILLFVITVLPALGIGTSNLANAETMGSSIDKYRLRISENAKVVYITYIVLTAAEFILLLFSGMGPFDAISNTFSSISNCGIVDYADGIQHYGSFYIEVIIAIFCIFGSTNFSTLQLLAHKRAREFIRDPEIRMFFALLGIAFVIITAVLWAKGIYGGLGATIKNSLLQIVSFVTTAGYAVTNYEKWPLICKMIPFFLAFIGGCSASTAGGLKVSRFTVILMLIRRNFYKRLHPNAVVAVKIGGRAVPADKVSNITVTATLYFLIFAGGCILLSFDGQTMDTTMGAVISALSNTGVIIGDVSLTHNFEIFSAGGRLLLSLLMLIGRLEIFAVFIMFTPSFWKRNN
jgi:trk system potassium uptake protein TrkH